jgi:hypothetical protein
MRPTVFVLAALLAMLAVPDLRAQQQAQILLAMTDASGAAVATFAPEDLVVFEDGKPAKVLTVEPVEWPLRVTLSLDNGRAMADTLVHIRAAAKDFVAALPEGTEISLVTTAPVPRFLVRRGKDREKLADAIDGIAPDSGPGRFVEGLQDVFKSWMDQPSESAFVLVTLGSTFSLESVNAGHLKEAFTRLNSTRGTVHVVLFKPANATEGEAQIEFGQRAARESRGRFEEIGSHLQLSILADLGKTVAATDAGRQFRVTLQRPEGATGRLGLLSMSPASGLKPGRITRLP